MLLLLTEWSRRPLSSERPDHYAAFVISMQDFCEDMRWWAHSRHGYQNGRWSRMAPL